VFVGRGDPTKGLHVALAAWELAALSDAEFYIAGALQADYAATMRSALALPSVHTLGFVADIPGLLSDADVLLLPSWTEGSALVILEAQATGCVPLVSVASGALGSPGVDFFEHPVGAVDTLAEQLRMLAGDPELLGKISRGLTERRSDISWDAAGAQLVACYRKGLDRLHAAR
jgi:glycosyltransferase involved in cell wall biosynthesis